VSKAVPSLRVKAYVTVVQEPVPTPELTLNADIVFVMAVPAT
jgi:hypothetical protein